MKPDKIYFSLALLFILTVIPWIISCTHETKIADMPEICFEADVLPIFANSCAISGCHDGTGESHQAFDNYPDISHTVVPYNPDASQSYKAITATWGENKMPPDRPLSLENRTIIRIWILQGARLTNCPVITMTGGAGGGFIKIPPTGSFPSSKSHNFKSGLTIAF